MNALANAQNPNMLQALAAQNPMVAGMNLWVWVGDVCVCERAWE